MEPIFDLNFRSRGPGPVRNILAVRSRLDDQSLLDLLEVVYPGIEKVEINIGKVWGLLNF